MIKRLCFALLFLLIYAAAPAQNVHLLKGRVTDSLTGKPVSGCSVFINNSSKGTITNANGDFVLQNLGEGKFELIISSIGYETFSYDFNTGQLPPVLYVNLKQKQTELSVITVEPYLKQT